MRKLPFSLTASSLLCAVILSSASGCKKDTQEAPRNLAPPIEGSDPAISDKSLPRLASGTMDIHNRYATTVMLTEEAHERSARCTGILLNSRVALTAASCVCSIKKEGAPEKRLITAQDCPERTFLRTVHYGEVKDLEFKEETTVKSFESFEGHIRPHPELKLVIDEQGAIQSSYADLALIILDTPVKDSLQFVPLGESDVKEGEMLVMAGYPRDARFGGFSSIRYFRRNKVTQFLGSQPGRALYEQQAPFLYNGYAGGPCIREDKDHQWLVGVASIGSDRELSFTSTYPFIDWLRAGLQPQ